MNIFYLDSNPIIAAQMHMDRHLVKMPWEYKEILDGDAYLFSDWVKESTDNCNYLTELIIACCNEFKFRYGQVHPILHNFTFVKIAGDGKFTEPPMHVPKMARCNSVCKAYRNYYSMYLWHMATWSFREIPIWFHPSNREVFYLGDTRGSELQEKGIFIPRQYDMKQWEKTYA